MRQGGLERGAGAGGNAGVLGAVGAAVPRAVAGTSKSSGRAALAAAGQAGRLLQRQLPSARQLLQLQTLLQTLLLAVLAGGAGVLSVVAVLGGRQAGGVQEQLWTPLRHRPALMMLRGQALQAARSQSVQQPGVPQQMAAAKQQRVSAGQASGGMAHLGQAAAGTGVMQHSPSLSQQLLQPWLLQPVWARQALPSRVLVVWAAQRAGLPLSLSKQRAAGPLHLPHWTSQQQHAPAAACLLCRHKHRPTLLLQRQQQQPPAMQMRWAHRLPRTWCL